jgi:putative acetyltransferase
MNIQAEQPENESAVGSLLEKAFGGPDQAALVADLRKREDVISLVAVEDGEVAGHILFSPVQLLLDGVVVAKGYGLAPMAVASDRQRAGIGGSLIEAGLERLREDQCPFVVVLGHPDYYPRFGFEPASRRGVRCEYEGVPDEAFMILVLDEERFAAASGVARYCEEFARHFPV